MHEAGSAATATPTLPPAAPATAPLAAEPARLATLRRLGLLDAAVEPAFDRATRLAARFPQVPVSLVTFVDEDRVVFKSSFGLPDMTEIQLRAEIAERVQAEEGQARSRATEEAANRRADRILASITAASAGKNQGSEFTIRLPAARPDQLAPAPPPVPTTTPAIVPRMRVLVVDDNHDTARGMARLSRIAGHEVQVAHDGWAAIEVARTFAPDAVLLDIGLPGLDGYEVATRLRHEDRCQGALLIAASGYGEDQARDRSREAGFNHHLTKPVAFDAITSLLNQPVG